MTTKIPAELSSTPGIVDNSNATAITIDSSENVTINGDTFINRNNQTSGVIKFGGTTNGGFIDFDGGSLQLNTQRDPNTGTFVNTSKSHASIIMQGNDGDSNIRFLTTSSNNTTATERMRIDSSGKVGLGDTSPDAMLKVVSNSSTVVGSWIRGDQYGLRVSGGSTSSHYALRVANSSDSSLMTVNGDGKVMIGGTSPSALFQVNGTVAFSHAYSSNATALNITNTVGTNNYFAQAFYSSSSLAGYIFVASSTNTTQYATSGSDLSFKENIKDWDENVLDKFKNIKPVTFNFKSDETKEEIKGYIAQNEVDKFPEAYPKNPTDEKHWFNPSGMTVYLMKAIKEQQAIIEDLKSRIETLEG